MEKLSAPPAGYTPGARDVLGKSGIAVGRTCVGLANRGAASVRQFYVIRNIARTASLSAQGRRPAR